MTTITLPPEVEKSLVQEALKRGTSPELLAVDCLRKHFVPVSETGASNQHTTLFDFLAGYIGNVDGTTEPLSERCGQRFAQGLAEKQQRGRL